MLIPMKELLLKAQKGGYAVPAFNFYNHPSVDGLVEEAAARQSPVILMASGRYVRSMGLRHVAALGIQAAESAKTPVALLLDHGDSLELAEECAGAGFTSVMIDGSRKPVGENIRLTQSVVSMAHARGLTVEAELGAVGGVEDAVFDDGEESKLVLVDPDEAAQFVRATGVDCLAPAIGNVHGITKQSPRLDLDLLRRVRAAVDVPLVLHGGSGLAEGVVRDCIAVGMSKFNVGSEIKRAWKDGLSAYFATGKYEPRIANDAAKEAVRAVAGAKMELAGSAGKA